MIHDYIQGLFFIITVAGYIFLFNLAYKKIAPTSYKKEIANNMFAYLIVPIITIAAISILLLLPLAIGKFVII